MGMLSYQAIIRRQDPQRDRGETTDSRAGSRAMHTLRKLPMQSPVTNAIKHSIIG
jgi:hypothetical protein